MGQSKLFPKWLRPQSLLPHWLGVSEEVGSIIIKPDTTNISVRVLSPDIYTVIKHGHTISTLRNWTPSVTEFLKKKITAKVNFITLDHGEDIHRLKPDLKRQTFLKPKYPPTAQLNNIEFKEITDD